MRASVEGRSGESMPFDDLVRIVDRHAYKYRHIAYNERGVQKGLPPNVATVQMGPLEDGLWWNARVGYIPERTTYMSADFDNYDDVALTLARMGVSEKWIEAQDWRVRTKKRRPASVGWREVLGGMLRHKCIRPNAEAEEWLGRRDYEKALRRQDWGSVNG